MKNVFSKLKKQIFYLHNIILSLLSLGIILWVFVDFENLYHYQEGLQNIQISLLTLMIPLAMELYKFSDKGSDDKESFQNQFIKSKNLIKELLIKRKFPVRIILVIIFISTVLSILGISTYLIFYISLIANLILAYFIIDIFNILNNPKVREEFYKNTLETYNESLDKTVDLWESYWSNKTEIDLPYDSTIGIFITRLDNKKIKKENEEIWRLLGVFYKHIDNRKTIPKILITKLFEYSYNFWHQYQESAENKENASKGNELYEIYRISENILIKILQKSLQDPHPVSATIDFFEVLDRHLQEHKDKVIQFKGKDKNYLEFFKYFGQRVITEILNMPDEYSARDVLEYQWSKSDRNWQINLSNLQSEKDNKITYYWLNIMLEYVSNIWRKDFNRPKKIEYKDIKKVNILINAFIPDINPEPFMQITELWFWSKEANAVKMYIENRVFTGIMSNVELLSFDYNTTEEEENSVWEKRNKEQIQKAIYIIVKIYERYGLNKAFCENIENQIKKINRNELDDNKLDRLDSLQKTIELIAERFK